MAVTATTSATGTSSTSSTSNGLSGIAGADFMNLLIKQLQYQDPLEPMSNQEMMQQMATIRQLEMNTQLSDRLQQVTDQQRFGSAAVLIGRHVQGTVSDDSGNEYTIEGVVQSVHFTSDGEVLLELDDGDVLPMANLGAVTDVDTTQTQTQTDATTTAKLINQAKSLTPAQAAKGIARTFARAIGL